jgi:putative acetyltransferase
MGELTVRAKTAWDGDAVARLLAESFPTGAEAVLAARLWKDGDMALSLVGETADGIVAYAAYSRMTAPFRAIGLSPVATRADARGSGHASALIRKGLEMARTEGWQACFVLGNPKFYGRFGFSADLARGFRCKYSSPSFMCAGLQDGELPSLSGEVAYAKAFV